MIRAFLFYLYRTSRNRLVVRLKRLRRPKYLLSGLAGLAYVYVAFLRQFLSGARAQPPPQLTLDPNLLGPAEILVALVLLALVLAPWLSFGRPNALLFTEAEIQFLFPAPISRRALLRYRIARGQVAILFGVLVSILVFARPRLVPHRLFLFVTVWVVYSFLGLYRMGTSLAKTSLLEHGAAGFRRQLWVVASLLALFGAVVVWLRWFVPAPLEMAHSTPAEVLAWLRQAAESGPAFYLLLPFRTLVHPALAAGVGEFLLRLVPALGVLVLTYAWVLNSHARFEEAAVARAQTVARRIEAARSGVVPRRSSRTPFVPFRLRPDGPAHSAFLWKNLISVGRVNPWRLILVLSAVALAIGFSSMSRRSLLMIAGGMASGIAAFLTVLGPVILRNDLRMDLLHLDAIKTYPIPGWRVVLGEVLAPAALLGAAEWCLVLVAAATLTGLGQVTWGPSQRFSLCLGAMTLLPCLSLMALLVQNAAALVVPGWVQLGRTQQRGIEAMGQRLITMVATIVALAVAGLPAGAVFAAAYFPGSWLLGYAAIPLAALFAGAALLIEATAVIAWLGRLFDNLDPSEELSEGSP